MSDHISDHISDHMTVPAILYVAAGEPPMPGDARGVCRTCGTTGVGVPFERWVKATFNDHNRLMPGEIVCHACLFTFDDSSALLQARLGRDKPQRLRNYSHFVLDGVWHPLSKANKREMVELLRAGPEVAVIAVSGQKHILFRARPGWWQIEEATVLPFGVALWPALTDVERLYNGGFSKAEIATGQYIQRRIIQFGLGEFLELEARLRPQRGTMPLELALFLAQILEVNDERVRGLSGAVSAGAESADPAVARAGGGLQNTVRPQHLATVRGQRTQRGVHKQPEQIHQLDLFAPAGDDPG